MTAPPGGSAGEPSGDDHALRLLLDVVTIFPAYLAPLQQSLLGKAQERGLVGVRVHDLRTWGAGVHRAVDDAPFGGGPGMVMRPEPWAAALDHVAGLGGPTAVPRLVVPTPSGRPFTQELAAELAQERWLAFACGRYEGIDARVVEHARDTMRVDEVSIGDYVLAGGEVAVLVIAEAVSRLLPGVLGNAESAVDDSFAAGSMAGLLEGPAYTRPAVWRGREVPAVLRSGDHAAVARWRRREALRRTAERRPDLLARLDPADLALLADAGLPADPVLPADQALPADQDSRTAGRDEPPRGGDAPTVWHP